MLEERLLEGTQVNGNGFARWSTTKCVPPVMKRYKYDTGLDESSKRVKGRNQTTKENNTVRQTQQSFSFRNDNMFLSKKTIIRPPIQKL